MNPLVVALVLTLPPTGSPPVGGDVVAREARRGVAVDTGVAVAPSGRAVADPGAATSVPGRAMATIPGGLHTPAFADLSTGEDIRVRVDAFELDRFPVTVADFLEFVRVEPTWRRSRAPRVLVGPDYLSTWSGDTDPGIEPETLERPATEVSWFAARAFCESRGARLPTTDEWEWAASAGPAGVDGPGGSDEAGDGARRPLKAILRDLYARRPAPDRLSPVGSTFLNRHGVWDLHGAAWEWTSDFNSQMATGSGRDDQGLDRQLFCAAGSLEATDRSDYAAFQRYSYRASLEGDYAGRALGFRCARDVDDPDAAHDAKRATPSSADPGSRR